MIAQIKANLVPRGDTVSIETPTFNLELPQWMTYETEVVAKKLPREPYRIARKTAINQGEAVNRSDRRTCEAFKHIG